MKKSRMMNLLTKNRELITYIIFGLLTTLVNWVVYSLLVELLSLPLTASNAIAWFSAVLFAFVTNKIYVFNSKSRKLSLILREATTFFCSRLLSGVIEVFLPTLLFSVGLNQSLLGIKGFASKLAVSVIVIVLNYVTSKFIVFNTKMKGNPND